MINDRLADLSFVNFTAPMLVNGNCNGNPVTTFLFCQRLVCSIGALRVPCCGIAACLCVYVCLDDCDGQAKISQLRR